MSVKYHIQGFKLLDGEWISCSPTGDTTGYGELMSPSAIGAEIKGSIIEDSPFRYSLGSDLEATSCGSLTLQIPNHDGYYGGMADDLPFKLFVERQDEYLLLLSAFVPANEFAHYGAAYEGTGAARCVWRGFLSNSRFVNGGDYIILEFNDLTYFSGRFRCGDDYALIDRKELFDRLADKLPFVVGDEADPDDHGVDDHIEDLPPIWDMRIKAIVRSLARTREDIEIIRKNSNTLWVRRGIFVREVDIDSGESPVGTDISSLSYSPPSNHAGTRFLYDPFVQGSDGLIEKPVPMYIDSDENIPPQDCYGYDVLMAILDNSGGALRLRTATFNPITLTFGLSFLTATRDSHGQSDFWVVFGRRVDGMHVYCVSPRSGGRGYSWSGALGDAEYPFYQTGQIRFYLPGHKIGDVEYPFLGYNELQDKWTWNRVLSDNTIETVSAEIFGDNSERAQKRTPRECYYLDSPRYPNCVCYIEQEDNYDALIIVNDRFQILDKLYFGERASSKESNIASMTITGTDNMPTTIGYCPQGHAGYIDDALHIARLQHDTPDAVPRLFTANESVGKSISAAARIFGAWAWIKPNMRIELRTPGEPVATGVDLLPHITLEDGNEDEIGYWDQNFESVKVEYGVDREMTIGIKRWETKQADVDLKETVFAEDFAEKIGLQNYIVYKPRRLHAQSPLCRALLFDLWSEFELHGRKWAVLETEMEPLGLSGFVAGISAPVSLRRIWEETAFWFEFVIYDAVQWGWYYNGMIPVFPGSPWEHTEFIGDVLGYPPAACSLLRALLTRIISDLNDEGYTGDFDSWWERNNMRYWSDIYEIIMLLIESGYYG